MPVLRWSILCEEVMDEGSGIYTLVKVFDYITASKLPIKHHFFVCSRWEGYAGEVLEYTITLRGPDGMVIGRLATVFVDFSKKSIIKAGDQDGVTDSSRFILIDDTYHTPAICQFIDYIFERPGAY